MERFGSRIKEPSGRSNLRFIEIALALCRYFNKKSPVLVGKKVFWFMKQMLGFETSKNT